jgi:transketolase
MLPPIEEPAAKWKAFGWNTIEVDGNDMAGFVAAMQHAYSLRGKPTIIIAHTIKGKGVSFMEDQYDWHARVPTDQELRAALAELGQSELAPAALVGG